MGRAFTELLREFLTKRRILGEVARRMQKSPSTLASELNSTVPNAKFGLDDFRPLCLAVYDLGYGTEFRALLHEYFESLAGEDAETIEGDELTPIMLSLVAKTAALADSASRLVAQTDEAELRRIEQMVRSELMPTAIKLGTQIDLRLGRYRRPWTEPGGVPEPV